jgi:hypothetical protein
MVGTSIVVRKYGPNLRSTFIDSSLHEEGNHEIELSILACSLASLAKNGDSSLALEISNTKREFRIVEHVMEMRFGIQDGDYAGSAGFFHATGRFHYCNVRGTLVNKVRTLDLEGRGAKKIETVPDFVVNDALAGLQAFTY